MLSCTFIFCLLYSISLQLSSFGYYFSFLITIFAQYSTMPASFCTSLDSWHAFVLHLQHSIVKSQQVVSTLLLVAYSTSNKLPQRSYAVFPIRLEKSCSSCKKNEFKHVIISSTESTLTGNILSHIPHTLLDQFIWLPLL